MMLAVGGIGLERHAVFWHIAYKGRPLLRVLVGKRKEVLRISNPHNIVSNNTIIKLSSYFILLIIHFPGLPLSQYGVFVLTIYT